MALQGTLREYSLDQLLNLVHIARKSGGLAVQSSQGAADLFFDEGKLVAAAMGQPLTLAALMVQSGKLSPDQAANLAASSGATDDKQVGLLLLNTGQISRDDIVQALRQSVLDVLYVVWGWEDGSFVFDQTRTPPPGRVTIPISLERILVEGSRHRQEQVQPAPAPGALPSLDVALRFTEGFGEHLRSVDLSPKEWRIISAINPRNSVAAIAQRNGMSEAEIGDVVARLLREGLVEVAGAPESGPAPETPLASRGAAPDPAPAPARETPPAASAAEEPLRGAASYSQPSMPTEPAPAEAKPQTKEGVVERFLSRFRRS